MTINIGELLTKPSSWIIFGVLLIAILYSLRSYFGTVIQSLFFDFGVDAGASELDNLLGGVGLTGLDLGDFAAGFLIFFRYKKQLGTVWAFFLALEACNFFLGFIPGIGEGIETFFNFFPAITFVVLWKQYQANQIYQPVREYYEYLKEESPEIARQLEPEYQEVKTLYENYAYLSLETQGSAKKEAFFLAIKEVIEERLIAVEQQLSSLPQEEARQYQARVQAVKDEIETDWRDAASYAQELEQQVNARAAQLQKQAA